MKYLVFFSSLLIPALVCGKPAKAPATVDHEFVSRYCAGCHNDKLKAGGFSFAQVDLAHPAQNAEKFEKLILKIQTGMMQMGGLPRPKTDAANAFVTDLETRLDRAAATHPN